MTDVRMPHVGDADSFANRMLAGVLVVALPTLVTIALIAVLFKATLLDYFPRDSDELAYHQQIAAFARAGFSSGYFTILEKPASFTFSHFGPHGPVFPLLYGSVGRVAGWTLQSGPIFNLVVLAMATAVFIVVGRLSRAQIVDLGFVMLTSWWVLFMLPTTMQETFHQSVMIVVAAFAARLLHPDTRRHHVVLMIALGVLVVASVMRPTNWIAAIPLVFIAFAPRGFRVAALVTLLTGVATLGFWLLWRYVSAPIPNLAIDLPALSRVSLLQYAVGRASTNARAVYDVRSLVAQPFSQYVMFESAVLVAAFGWFVARGLARRRREKPRLSLGDDPTFKTDAFVLIGLGAALAAFVGLYVEADLSLSRVMAPFTLLVTLLLVATRQRTRVVVLVVVGNVLIAPSFLSAYTDARTGLFTYDRHPYERFRSQIAPFVTFDSSREPWCNTLLTTVFIREIVALPPGVGLSVGEPPDAVRPAVRSRYLLTTDEGARVFQSKATLRHLTTTEFGDLYENLAVPCGAARTARGQ